MNRWQNCAAADIPNNHSQHTRLIFSHLLSVERTHSSALYLCLSLLDIVDLGKFCFSSNGGQSVYVGVCVFL